MGGAVAPNLEASQSQSSKVNDRWWVSLNLQSIQAKDLSEITRGWSVGFGRALLFEGSRGQRRRWAAARDHEVPVGPRSWVDDAWRRLFDGLEEVFVADVPPYLGDVLRRGACHRVGHEPYGIRQRLLWFFEPYEPAGDRGHFWIDG